jgi:iron(III) transport system substrate-binding protein
MKIPIRFMVIVVVLLMMIVIVACSSKTIQNQVVVYTSVDQIFSEPILDKFEAETGIEVLAVYDVEAAKTTGLVNRLIAEKNAPRADVWWNSEIIQTLVLKEKGVLAPYVSPEFEAIPESYRDPQGYWAGVGGRARVIIVNTNRIGEPGTINSIYDLINPRWEGDLIGIAYPLFGTAATHAAALYAYLGPQTAGDYFVNLVSHGVNVLDGNSIVRDLVANGILAFGLTDTDDACGALMRGDPVAIIFPDQDDMGTLVIPGSVAMIAGAPHFEQAKILIDYLISARVERMLVEAGFSHIPIHPDVEVNETCISTQSIRGMDVEFSQVYGFTEILQTELREIFLR